MSLQWPWARPFILTITMVSGRQLQQECWSYTINRNTATDQVLSTQWEYAGPGPRLKVARADQIAAVQEGRGPRRWRGWRA